MRGYFELAACARVGCPCPDPGLHLPRFAAGSEAYCALCRSGVVMGCSNGPVLQPKDGGVAAAESNFFCPTCQCFVCMGWGHRTVAPWPVRPLVFATAAG